jgi:hypothetical protein
VRAIERKAEGRRTQGSENRIEKRGKENSFKLQKKPSQASRKKPQIASFRDGKHNGVEIARFRCVYGWIGETKDK